ncbi:MAG: YeeE/YedE family protein, partial [Halobacteria archaeon]|nr:YeeE/YedE family protein [Halobacteria archaeon]
MAVPASVTRYEPGVVIPALLGVTALALFINHDVSNRQALLLLIGSGLGFSLFHAAFGFAGGWRRFVRERRSAAIRAQLLLVALVSLAFFPLLTGTVPGLSLHGAYAPVGMSVLVGAFLFGIGMQLGGGCGSGTLYTVGGGHIKMLVTLVFFIAGSVIGSIHLPWWTQLPSLGKISLLAGFGWPVALGLQLLTLTTLYLLVTGLEQQRYGDHEPLTLARGQRSLLQRLVSGPWPVIWGAAGLALLSLATLLVAGHPWSITFAFGLWGTKLWAALGG